VGPTRQRGKGRTGGIVLGLILGRGWLLELGRKASRGPFSYFSLLKFFFFSVFLILSQILQKSLQGFKLVGKQVFKIRTRFLIELWVGAKGFACIKLFGA
jgi:hypothetical protein